MCASSQGVIPHRELGVLLPHALSFAYAHGLVIGAASREPAAGVIHAPFALLPRKLPRAAFESAYALAPLWGPLVDAIACDGAWLAAALARTGAADAAFTGRLLDMWSGLEREAAGAAGRDALPLLQPLRLGLLRSDYMLDEGEAGARRASPSLKQVELNTIASSFGGLSSVVGALHTHLAARFGAGSGDATCPVAAAYLGGDGGSGAPTLPPPSSSCTDLARALAAAHAAFVSRRCARAPAPVVAFVVQTGERNVLDQGLLEAALWEEHRIRVRRVTLAALGGVCVRLGAAPGHEEAAAARCTAPSLLLAPASSARWQATDASGGGRAEVLGEGVEEGGEGPWDEVSVVYFRSGYAPDDYGTSAAWEGRERAERSRAVKCPPLGYHLVGTKKVQQLLAAPGVLERFVPNATHVSALRSCFAGLWSLDWSDLKGGDAHPTAPDARAAIAAAQLHPEAFVLKPQREGGGNNIYGAAVAEALAGFDEEARGGAWSREALAGHILMQRLWPAPAPALLVRNGAVVSLPTVVEFGVYSAFLTDGGGGAPLLNAPSGHLLRTKALGTDEGGVAAGFAVLDSPLLS